MSLQEISRTYQEQYERRLSSPEYASIRQERNALPAATYQERVLETINAKQVTLIKGETGCGKTTQVGCFTCIISGGSSRQRVESESQRHDELYFSSHLNYRIRPFSSQIPQFILDSFLSSGRGAECSVLVTQPRRICAISLAERIASERCEPVGTSVGYSVRFETVLPRPYGSILFCTVGTLCRKMEAGIRGISHIIIDEIHERDVNTDFMLILIRELVRVNRELRVILMSATIDTTTFTEYFGDCAMVELEGRTHPVTCKLMAVFLTPVLTWHRARN